MAHFNEVHCISQFLSDGTTTNIASSAEWDANTLQFSPKCCILTSKKLPVAIYTTG